MPPSRIDTFLDFINLDLDAATQEELLRSAMFVSTVSIPSELSFRFGLKLLAPKLETLLENESTLLRQTQHRLKSILVGIEQWSLNQTLTDEEKQTDNNGLAFHTLFEWNAPFTVNLVAQLRWSEEEEEEAQPDLFDTCPMRVVFTCHDLLNAVVFNFCRTLEGIEVNSLRTCVVCKKWLLQQTKKKKLYCSNVCSSRDSGRQRYEKKRADKSKTMPAKKTMRGLKIHLEST